MVDNPEKKPTMYNLGDIARAGIQDNTPEAKRTGHKSAKSIASRVQRDRDYYLAKGIQKEATVGDVSDLTRCTMIIGSFSEVPSTLRKLKQKLPFLQVTICDHSKEGGYSAIHLRGVNKEGIPYEIQLHTPESFYLKQISEYEYSHWREFNYEAEVLKVKQIKDPAKRQEAQRKIDEIKAQKDQDEKKCEDVYYEMHQKADARISDEPLKSEIEAIAKEINEEYSTNLENGVIPLPQDHKEIKKFKNVPQEKLLKALEKSPLLKKLLPKAQGQLIENCEMVLGSIYAPKVQKISRKEIREEQKISGKPFVIPFPSPARSALSRQPARAAGKQAPSIGEIVRE